MVTEILNEYRQRISNSGDSVYLYCEYSEGGPIIIEGDRNRLCQVIDNLLDNALKFTTKGSIRIVLERHSKDNMIIVKVRDTGIGIHPDILPKLFTKFATKSDTGGTGLGLFICKSIVEKHGGNIWAENNRLDGNTGATFTFRLPLDTNKI